jgi:dihydropteroate synthase
MGILNVTPDSFSDGGRFDTIELAMRQAETMAKEGAAILDIGGESTRPGAAPVNVAEELDRVIPVIEALRKESDLPLSIDTSKPDVMRAAVSAGAVMINDVLALKETGAVAAAAESDAAICLMHMKGRPRTMQQKPEYDDVIGEIAEFLRERVRVCTEAGIAADRICVDPGFGFGKTPAHNVEMLGNLRQLRALGLPILVGVSRKSTLGEICGRNVEERMPASIAAAVVAVMNGAAIIRAHDVRETVDALKVASAVLEGKP